MLKERQKQISFSLKEEGKDILLREQNAKKRRRRRRRQRGVARALHMGTRLTLRLAAPLRMVPGAVAGRPPVPVCT